MKQNRFFKPFHIFILDVALSWVSSFIVIFLLLIVSSNYANIPDFIREWTLFSLAGAVISTLITRSYNSIVRYSNTTEFIKYILICFIKEACLWSLMGVFSAIPWNSNLLMGLVFMDFFVTLSILLTFKLLMIAIYENLNSRIRLKKHRQELKNILIYGNSVKSVAVLSRLKNSPHFNIKGFIISGPESSLKKIADKPVFYYHGRESLENIVEFTDINGILFSTANDARNEESDLIEEARNLGLKQYITPQIDEIGENGIKSFNIRRIHIEDLLGREEIEISLNEIKNYFSGKNVMVTGAAGSIGSELCRQLAGFDIKSLILFDNAESPLHNIRLELEEKFPKLEFYPVIGDVRSKKRLNFVFSRHKIDIVFHAAAYKHVPLMEENPCEAVLVNVIGSKNIADKCIEYNVERMVMVSTDKAVNPTNIMGCTKRLAEIYVQSLGLAVQSGEVKGKTMFVTTRFGNVLGSNGSVIPRFRQQIEKGGPITVTHPEINRFFMTIPEACRLVMEAATFATETQIFVFDMGEPVKIADLAIKMIELAGLRPEKDIKIKYTGLRPGEKLYEEVLATKENTLPTSHDRIFIASVREYPYSHALDIIESISTLAYDWEIPKMVKSMKEAVPEFKSKNSEFEKLD